MKKKKRIQNVLAAPLGIKRIPFPKHLLQPTHDLFAAPIGQNNKERLPLANFSSEDIRLLATLGTNLWRARQRLLGILKKESQTKESKRILRPIESAIENIENIGIKIMDFTGQPYVQGMALNIVSSQPNSSLKADRIYEMLKPTIYFREQFIQAGDAIIEGPFSSSS